MPERSVQALNYLTAKDALDLARQDTVHGQLARAMFKAALDGDRETYERMIYALEILLGKRAIPEDAR